MNKDTVTKSREPYLSIRGQKRLLFYAQILEELSDYYSEEKTISSGKDRKRIWQENLSNEQSKIMEGQLRSLSHLLENMADESIEPVEGYEKYIKKLMRKLTENDLIVEDIRVSRQNYARIKMEICCMAKEGDYFSTNELAEFVSSIIHKPLVPDVDNPAYIHHKKECIVLREELYYQYYVGKAQAVKEGEQVSGDYFIYSDYADGRSLLALADGMGSGEVAGEDAAFTLELLDKLLEAGMTLKDATCQVNDILCMRCRKLRTVSVDCMLLDLYSGEATIRKSGAAPLFVIRRDKVERKVIEALPLGIIPGSFGESAQFYVSDQDQIVLVSDGILEALGDESGEKLTEALAKMHDSEPKSLAAKILTMATMASSGRIADDMTVIVVNICERG